MAVLEQAILAQPFAKSVVAADAVEALVREHARFVFQVAYAVLRHGHDAEDVVQETFLRVVRHQAELSEVREPKAWLARIAWRIAVDRRRNQPEMAADPEAQLAQLHATGMSAEQMVARDEMKRLVEALVAALPNDLREPLQLSTLEEMPAAQIAAVLGIPEATVRTR
ncbi:MAG: sigma-70 family RNA polymerase sigma factor, partial [Acidobacteriota bacterium]|nr:sigma-70 family RNA polymerase sigma factor [Acidobacteriota bacterium]